MAMTAYLIEAGSRSVAVCTLMHLIGCERALDAHTHAQISTTVKVLGSQTDAGWRKGRLISAFHSLGDGLPQLFDLVSRHGAGGMDGPTVSVSHDRFTREVE